MIDYENASMHVCLDLAASDLQLHGTTLVCTDKDTNLLVVVQGWIWENLKDCYTPESQIESASDSEVSDEVSDYNGEDEDDEDLIEDDEDDDDYMAKPGKRQKAACKQKTKR